MGTDPGIERRWLLLHSQAGVSPRPFTNLLRESVLSPPAWRAFADGFGGGLIGGLVYCLVMAYIDPRGLDYAWLRVLALSLTFGALEMWRISRKPSRAAGTFILCALTASMIVLWALGAVLSAVESPRQEPPPRFHQSSFAQRA